jgi:hypothetical protein
VQESAWRERQHSAAEMRRHHVVRIYSRQAEPTTDTQARLRRGEWSGVDHNPFALQTPSQHSVQPHTNHQILTIRELFKHLALTIERREELAVGGGDADPHDRSHRPNPFAQAFPQRFQRLE